MDKIWQELFDVLADMLSTYRKLLELGRTKREALVGAKVKEIDSITKQEESLIIFISHSEKVRKAIIEKIAAKYALLPEELNLSKIKQVADADIAKQVERFEKDFRNVLSEFEPVSKTNNELIQQALRIVNYNINIITQSTTNLSYAPQKQEGQTLRNKAIFDKKV